MINLSLVIVLVWFNGNLNGGKKVLQGYNSFKDAWNGCNYTNHAEMDIIRKLNRVSKHKETKREKRKKTYNLVVIRVNKQGNLRDSKPCHRCLEALYATNFCKIKYVYYSTNNGTIVKRKFADLYDDRSSY